jgi:hypothetical protein
MTMKLFKVVLSSGVGACSAHTEYVLAPDSEHAAWQALELSAVQGVTLIDVRPHNDDMW